MAGVHVFMLSSATPLHLMHTHIQVLKIPKQHHVVLSDNEQYKFYSHTLVQIHSVGETVYIMSSIWQVSIYCS